MAVERQHTRNWNCGHYCLFLFFQIRCQYSILPFPLLKLENMFKGQRRLCASNGQNEVLVVGNFGSAGGNYIILSTTDDFFIITFSSFFSKPI